MKAQRHAAIMRLIRTSRIQNQEQLRDLLAQQSIEVTQATLSRDIRELRIAKVSDAAGGSFYSVPPRREIHPSFEQLVPALLHSVSGVGPLLVLRTPAGSAEALGGALDAASWDGVLGTVAGDDTLLIVAASEEVRTELEHRLRALGGLDGT